MTRVAWDAPGVKVVETGLDRGVLYPVTGPGVAWPGLVSVSEGVTGGEVESFYYDGVKYMDVILYDDFVATLEAFSAPPEFAACDGTKQLGLGLYATQQPRLPFSMSYRTLVSNDVTVDAGYKIHLLYNCMASPAERTRTTQSESVEAPTTSWTINTRPAPAATYLGSTYKPTAHIIIDSRFVPTASRLNALENSLYGPVVGAAVAGLLTQQQIVNMVNTGSYT